MLYCELPAQAGANLAVSVVQYNGVSDTTLDPALTVSYEQCPLGYSDAGLAGCGKCSPGSYSLGSPTANCILCEPGKYAEADGASACLPVPAGTASNRTGVGSLSSQDDCEPGFYSTGGQTSCSACSAGRFVAKAAQAVCADCPPGKSQALEGNASCVACSAGSYSPQPGAAGVCCVRAHELRRTHTHAHTHSML